MLNPRRYTAYTASREGEHFDDKKKLWLFHLKVLNNLTRLRSWPLIGAVLQVVVQR
jgi:hypothetical protein